MWRLLILLGVILTVDLVSFFGSKRLRKNKTFKYIFWGSSILLGLDILVSVLIQYQIIYPFRSTRFTPTTFYVFLPKLLYIVVRLVFLTPQLCYWVVKQLKKSDSPVSKDRRRFLELSFWGIALSPLYWITKGIFFGRYDFTVRTVELFSEELPLEFEGFKITQFTDFHAGSLPYNEEYKKAFEIIQNETPDLISFTGDFVNNRAVELEPWVEQWKNLEAPFGKFAVLGNHDYGDYVQWKTDWDKKNNLNRLKKTVADCGFNLLLNQKVTLTKGDKTIDILGVENWGKLPFPQYGDIDRTLLDSKSAFKILLSHDPSHFDEIISTHQQKIQLTMSGHTHGFQFGIKLPWMDKVWSPSQFRYPRWKGLYEQNGRYLYVNPGFGTLAYPGRVNMPPEITTFVLRKA